MPKFFIVSDVHGFYNEMIDALNDAGFDKYNPEHWLISCGDHVDRGPDPAAVINYLTSLPRKVLIVGNHEQLIEECCMRGFPYKADKHNGTFQTICNLGGMGLISRNFEECCDVAWKRFKPFMDSMVNYFETEHYVFCHSWIPVIRNENVPSYYHNAKKKYTKREDWRDATDEEWNESMWFDPLQMVSSGFWIEKCIVSGHWHCSTGWSYTMGVSEFGDDAIWEPYNYKDKLIMIDRCTAHTGKVNVLVIEDEFLKE